MEPGSEVYGELAVSIESSDFLPERDVWINATVTVVQRVEKIDLAAETSLKLEL